MLWVASCAHNMSKNDVGERNTLSNRPNVAVVEISSALDNPCVHEGYLVKLSNGTRKRWQVLERNYGTLALLRFLAVQCSPNNLPSS